MTRRFRYSVTLVYIWSAVAMMESAHVKPRAARGLARDFSGMERDPAVISGCGLHIDDTVDVLNLIYSWVSGAVQAELTEQANAHQSGGDRHSWRMRMKPYLLSLLATGEFPHLSKMTEAAEFAEDNGSRTER